MIYLNGTQLPVTKFPDHTSQVWKLDQIDQYILSRTYNPNTKHSADVFWDFDFEDEFMHLAQLKALLDSVDVETSLKIKYLPYARQDKAITNVSTFALTVFAHLLNTLQFKEIVIVDPHSEDAIKMIYNSRAEYPAGTLGKVILHTGTDLLVYPDKGARTKYSKLPGPYQVKSIYGEKVRDQLTGNITNYQLVGDPKDATVLIVDDICDGGMTFKILAKDLIDAGAKEVNLFVTHGIFSKGLKTLKQSGIKKIFTQDGEAEEYDKLNSPFHNITYRRL